MTKLRDIAIKLIRGELPPLAENELTRERLKVCEDCEHFACVSRQCKLCWCFMDIKVSLLEAKCPAEKW